MNHDLQFSLQPRRVIESSECVQQLKELCEKFPRFLEVWISIRRELTDLAHHDAIKHPNLDGYHFKRTAACYETPSFTYYYKYDESTATIMHIEATDDSM
jgi:hypothetical protein